MTTEEKSDVETTKEVRKAFRLSDDLIAMIRETLQLSLLTGTNIVDHLRAMVVEVDDDGKYITVTSEYVVGYNSMIEKLNAEALEKMEEQKLEKSEEKLVLVDTNQAGSTNKLN